MLHLVATSGATSSIAVKRSYSRRDFVHKRAGSPHYQLRVPVPQDLQAVVGKKEITKSTGQSTRSAALAFRDEFLRHLHRDWELLRSASNDIADPLLNSLRVPSEAELLVIGQEVYEDVRKIVAKGRNDGRGDDLRTKLGRYTREFHGGDLLRWARSTEVRLQKRGFECDHEAKWFQDAVAVFAEAFLAAIEVENRIDDGEFSPEPRSRMLARAAWVSTGGREGGRDLPFDDLVTLYMTHWLADAKGKKETNTEAQKRATYRLYGLYCSNQPIRVTDEVKAAAFYDTLKLFDPNWARSPAAKSMSWGQLLDAYGSRGHGLAAQTMNRHLGALKSLWDWAHRRGHCQGHNPFDGFQKRLRDGENVQGYRAWENSELVALFSPEPPRADLREVMIVGLFTGMRLNEIVGLTWGQVRSELTEHGEVSYFDILDAKTPAGVRQVPVHTSLAWLLRRRQNGADERLWPTFNEEGVGKRPGNDASKLFSDFKRGRGFKKKTKTFHSFRKNVTRIMERAGVSEGEWAQVFGHERGFTFGTYNPDGITMARRAEIIELISYPGVEIPHPHDRLPS